MAPQNSKHGVFPCASRCGLLGLLYKGMAAVDKGAMHHPHHVLEWWRTLEEDDLISLEPLAELPYAPFELAADCSASINANRFFDGQVLAHYLVSSLNFVHPANRRPLSLDECARLDAYLAHHGLPPADVARAMQLREATLAQRASDADREAVLALREEANAILQSLYLRSSSSSSTRRRGPAAQRRRGDASRPTVLQHSLHTSAHTSAARTEPERQGVRRGGIIDDDEDGSFFVDGQWEPLAFSSQFPALGGEHAVDSGPSISTFPRQSLDSLVGQQEPTGWKTVGSVLSGSGGGFRRSPAAAGARPSRSAKPQTKDKNVGTYSVVVSWTDELAAPGVDTEAVLEGTQGLSFSGFLSRCPCTMSRVPTAVGGRLAATLEVRIPSANKHSGQHDVTALLSWFVHVVNERSGAAEDIRLEFPAALCKEARAVVHQEAERVGLVSQSMGFGEERFVSVAKCAGSFTDVAATSRPSQRDAKLGRDGRLLVDRILSWCSEQGGLQELPDFSRKEVVDMVLCNCLHPAVQALKQRHDKASSLCRAIYQKNLSKVALMHAYSYEHVCVRAHMQAPSRHCEPMYRCRKWSSNTQTLQDSLALRRGSCLYMLRWRSGISRSSSWSKMPLRLLNVSWRPRGWNASRRERKKG